jgi:hypothetical protein
LLEAILAGFQVRELLFEADVFGFESADPLGVGFSGFRMAGIWVSGVFRFWRMGVMVCVFG